MLNDKIIGMFCVTLIFLAIVAASIFTGKTLDPAIEKVASMIIAGIMGAVIGISLKKKV